MSLREIILPGKHLRGKKERKLRSPLRYEYKLRLIKQAKDKSEYGFQCWGVRVNAPKHMFMVCAECLERFRHGNTHWVACLFCNCVVHYNCTRAYERGRIWPLCLGCFNVD